MTKNDVINILKENNFTPQKQKGQNFLINDALSKKIVSLLNPNHIAVLEIGPGLGALTHELNHKFAKVTAVELDRGFAVYLEKAYKNITIITGNILKTNVPRETTAVISNLPYYITTKIIEHIVVNQPHVKEFVFMTESDVYRRLFAKKQTKAYSPLSIVFEIAGQLTKAFDVDRTNFYPAPHVNSTVFKFIRNDEYINIPRFYHFLKQAFTSRRKTLLNNFSHQKDQQIIKTFLTENGLNVSVRAEELSAQQLFSLNNTLNNEETKQD